MNNNLSQQQLQQFVREGYLVLPNLATKEELEQLQLQTKIQLSQRDKPFELEATVQYPGSPKSKRDEGGDTIRRLQKAYQRHETYKQWAENSKVTQPIQQILNSKHLFLTQNHHNSVMTKQPEFSSHTGWHRDTRYWHFNNKYLVNSWLALGSERGSNGGLMLLPGSHRWDDDSIKLDDQQFLINDHPDNQSRLSLAMQVDLQAGDCLLFSAHCFHAASQNHTDEIKCSLVFTYHGEETYGLENTQSSLLPSIKLY